MKTKKEIIGGILLLSILLSISFVFATITFDNPTSSNITITGETVNISVTTSDMNYTECNFSTTDDSVFANTLNTTYGQVTFYNITDTTTLTEVAGTTLSLNCSNSTSSETNTLTINIDNTAPTCSFTKDYDETTYISSIGVATTQGSTDTTTLTYAWTLWDLSGNSQQTSTDSAPTFSGTDFDEIGEFTLGLTATDGAILSTACTNQTIFVRAKDGVSQAIIPSVISQSFFQENKTPIIIGSIVFIIVLISIVSFIIIGKSK